MVFRFYLSIAAVSVLICNVSLFCTAGDNSFGWPMYGGNPAHTGRHVGASVSLDGSLNWETNLDNWLRSSPVVSPEGIIYIGTGDTLKAYDPLGNILWQFGIIGNFYSSPAIASDETIYIGASNGTLYAINKNGSSEWEYKAGRWIDSSPVIGDDGTIYFGSRDSTFYAVNPDGSEKWKYKTGGIIHSSAAISVDGTVYVNSNDSLLYAFDPYGTLKWQLPGIAGEISTPSIGNDGTIYIRSGWGRFAAITSDGTRKWADDIKLGSLLLTAAIGEDGVIYIGGYDHFSAINQDGSIKWQYPFKEVRSNPVIGSDGTIYVAGYPEYDYDNQYITAFTPDGAIKWYYMIMDGYILYDCWGDNCPTYLFPSPAIGPDGTLYVPTERGKLFSFRNEKSVSVITIKPKSEIIIHNYPNPFNPSTTISFILPVAGRVQLTIYSITGNKIQTLIDGWMTDGFHSKVFDGAGLSSGVYFYRIESGNNIQTGKMLLMR